MERLSLLKSTEQNLEKRVFPRFPFSYLMFRPGLGENEKAFAVCDISFSGMQLARKDGGHQFKVGAKIEGRLQWKKASAGITGSVIWVKGERLGVAFEKSDSLETTLRSFLSVDNIVSSMRPLHQEDLDLDLPANLMCWLQADGPVELFVWRHKHGEISGFHLLMMDAFIEYIDGKGLKSGKIIKSREMETPLTAEEEFDFLVDETVDEAKLEFGRNIVEYVPDSYCDSEIKKFILLKMGA